MNWDSFVAQHPYANLLQTSRWGQLKASFGWDWEIVTPETGSGGALVLYKSLPLKLGTIAYVPRGPVVNWAEKTDTQAVMAAVKKAARKRWAWALWIEPELFDSEEAAAQLQGLGFNRAARTIQPPSTIFVDIALSEDEILKRMKSKTRYNIRLAERKGVVVRQAGVDDVDTFYSLMQETSDRDVFGIHSSAYYRRILELLLPENQAVLLLAEFEGEAVAGLIGFAFGQMAWYICGASSNRHRNKMPAYAIQWAAIQWAKSRGCSIYDMWGIPDADEETLEAQFMQRGDGLWGVYRFKRGFGGRVVRYVGLWEKSLHPLYPLALRLRDYSR